MKMKIDVLGTKYTIIERSVKQDPLLENCDGYCDKTTQTIVVTVKEDDCQITDFESYQKKIKTMSMLLLLWAESFPELYSGV